MANFLRQPVTIARTQHRTPATMTWAYRFICLASLLVLPAAAQPLITTIAGTDFVFRGDGQPALQAPVGAIGGITVDRAGTLYFVDVDNNLVLKLAADGTVRIIAGNGIEGFS